MLHASSTFAQLKKLTPELLWQIGRVELDCVSPDGKYAVYGVQHYDVPRDKGFRTLYLLELSTGATRPLTDPDKKASDAEFSPDGKRIGFLFGDKLHEVSRDGDGIAVQVSEVSMTGFHYAPNGKYILYAQDVKHDLPASEKYPDLPNTKGRIFDGLMYRHWNAWKDGVYSNVFYASYEPGKVKGNPIPVMNDRYDSPLSPMGGMEQITWSPDCRWIVYTCRKERGTAEALSTNSNLFAYELASGKTLNFTGDLKGYDQDPVFSPDGNYLAWISLARPGNEADRPRLMVLDTRTEQRTEWTEGWPYEARHPQWAADSKSIYFISSTDFTYQMCQIDASKKVRFITSGQHDYTNLQVAGSTLIGTRTAMDSPSELYAVDPVSGSERRLTHVTDSPWNAVAKGKVERRTVKTVDGKDMTVWMIFPPDFDPAKKYPALLYCQGGPQSALSQFFSYRWNMQLMASNGYVVVAPCRRGMPGAGQDWCDEISGDWGGLPMQDLLSATDYAAKQPGIDAQRMGAVGASFGGYSVYWLAGNHQKRFKAFISHCGIFNLESFYASTEEVWFPNNEFGGAFWQSPKPESYNKFSPHLFVQNWDTPILIIDNELDFRIPVTEGMQAFQAAQLRGIPSRFLYFENEGHWVTKPQNSLLWQRVFFDWLDKYLK
jgi:dipeptidyl aminopeptidase/acylaminoacyl peptidase